MSEEFSFEENELTTEDLAILKAFDAIESWPTEGGEDSKVTDDERQKKSEAEDDAEMLIIFLEEATEDIARMSQAARQLAQEAQFAATRFRVFQRAGHKLRGTAAAVGYLIMSTAAEHIEIIAEQVLNEKVKPDTGLEAITQAISVLEGCQSYLVEEGQEPDKPELITALEATYQRLGIILTEVPTNNTAALPAQPEEISNRVTIPLEMAGAFQTIIGQAPTDQPDGQFEANDQLAASYPLFVHIENRRFEKLLRHTGQLIEMHAELENAQRDVRAALQAQQIAQNRLIQLEQSLTNVIRQKPSTQGQDETPSSSLIARILSDTYQEKPHYRRYRSRPSAQPLSAEESWDELDLEHYSEQDLLLQEVREAINQVTVCSARVNTASTALQIVQQEYMARASVVRDDTQMMRLTPLSTLVPRLRTVIAASALAQQYKVEFEVSGDALEIDQEILEMLSPPLVHMLQTCISDTSIIQGRQTETYHIWLHAHSRGNDITLEIGFSMPVLGGTLEILRAPLQRLNGTINLQRNSSGGVSFHLALPSSRSTIRCLLIRCGEQQFIVPMMQVQRVSLHTQEQLDQSYQLKDLLALSGDGISAPPDNNARPILIIQSASNKVVGIVVDEILSEQDLTIKPLPSYLRRLGIAEAAITGQGNTLLMLDLGELIRNYLQRAAPHNGQKLGPTNGRGNQQKKNNQTPKVLVADDSAYLRQAVLHTLKQGKYEVFEARDGMETIEQLLENTPDIVLLDIEMPNLNGYDVLNIIREYPELAHVKTIMLTSRTSDKHVQRAQELGALAYLVKPCPQTTLLNTIKSLLGENTGKHTRPRSPKS
ncbi:ATP-binding response regulator [Dictyobacter aurantiacus]|uniref:histidine kinase n=1 Tax=Dictyobacter aurantiacus TaxID=1936993 RepID=A0A401ZDM1_9CHLR|nr:hybrid sensor histidine kinase/response regulator [Dictyobacter aurantiacus]GCE04980.1 hypothetical protein KDAU_23090 [Dictyobacter aurantiacus]